MNGDTPIHRKTYLEMSDDEQIAFINEIRNKRNAPIQIYQKELAAKREAKLEKLNIAFEKAKTAFEKELDGFDKKVENLIKKANKLKQINIEINMEK